MNNQRIANQLRELRELKADIIGHEGRIPPQSVEVEEGILGAMLLDREAAEVGVAQAKTDWFYNPANSEVFTALREMHQNNLAVDMLTVEHYLRDKGKLSEIGGAGYLSDLTRSFSSAANIEYYIEIIKEKAMKRESLIKFHKLIHEGYDPDIHPIDTLEKAAAFIDRMLSSDTTNDGAHIQDALKPTLANIETRRANFQAGIQYTGVPTGLYGLDEDTGGWQNGDLIIIAARPSMGKTAFVLACAKHAAIDASDKYKTGTAIFNLEMDTKSLIKRFFAIISGIELEKIRKGDLEDNQLRKLVELAGVLFNANIIINDTPGITIEQLCAKARRYKHKYGIGMIVVDYLQLVTVSQNASTREQDVAQISRRLKVLSRELDVPVIALSQLSRAVEQRGGDKRPQLSDIRESGAIEQDADVVIFLYRPEYYNITVDAAGNSTQNVAEIIIAKQRNGPVSTRKVCFFPENGQWRNMSARDANNSLMEKARAGYNNIPTLEEDSPF